MAFWTQIKITLSGGGTVTLYSPTSGTVNGTNAQFGFATKPSIIVADAASYRENHGWTWNSGTMTATLATQPVYDVYGIA